jgi:hypothetical protein
VKLRKEILPVDELNQVFLSFEKQLENGRLRGQLKESVSLSEVEG